MDVRRSRLSRSVRQCQPVVMKRLKLQWTFGSGYLTVDNLELELRSAVLFTLTYSRLGVE